MSFPVIALEAPSRANRGFFPRLAFGTGKRSSLLPEAPTDYVLSWRCGGVRSHGERATSLY